jgi:HD superfamily phosphohydrolase
MMTVVDDQLVIEEKGIYSVEKFLMARRLMYWQVYFHKTSLVAELILTKVLKRAKELTQKGIVLNCSEPLLYFMNNKIELASFDNNTLDKFANLDRLKSLVCFQLKIN